jgi:Tol biopolymer transport system component
MNWLVTNDTDSTGKTNEGSCENLVISPDSKQIAYSWCPYKDTVFYDLRLIDLDGTNFRVLYQDATVFYIRPYDWSPDGGEILAYFSDADANLVDEKTGEMFRKGYLVLVSVADGSIRILKTWHRRSIPRRAVFSPDGQYIAYDFAQTDNLLRYDIFLMNLNGGSEIALIEHPANDRLFGWTPDGRRVVFISQRSSKRGLWMIEVAEGAPQGSPRALLGQLEGWPIGFTADGSFYYGLGVSASNVYLTRLDSTGLNFESEPELASSQFVGSATMGDFSPDGNFLAYRVGSGSKGGLLVVYSIETSDERIITPSPSFHPGSSMFGPRFSPDGQSLLVYGEGQESGYGPYTIDVKTGVATPIVSRNKEIPIHAVWSPDGESIYICSVTSLSRLDLVTSRETELYQAKDEEMMALDVSPDGRWLAFYCDMNSLVVMSSTGGEPQEVVHLEEDEVSNSWNHVFVRWTPDGEYLLFSKRKNELWKVNIETGAQQQISLAIEGSLVGAAMHPDGRQITFTALQRGSQLWVMENFLPD